MLLLMINPSVGTDSTLAADEALVAEVCAERSGPAVIACGGSF